MSLTKAWYPAVIGKKLKKSRPMQFKLFGQPFALYRDQSGQVVCVEDRCPHRGTPLSLGRVIQGQLECRYHGWRFAQQGRCSRIPTLAAGKEMPPNVHANTRACIEKYGVIWVWPEASTVSPPFPDFLFPTHPYQYRFSSWDVPVQCDLLLENLFDLSHLPFVHHNTLSRRSRAQPITFDLLDDPDAVFSANARYHSAKRKSVVETYKFIAPGLAQYEFNHVQRRNKIITQFYCVPMTKDTTRIFNYTFMKMHPLLFKLFNNPITMALGTPIAKLVTKQDKAILQGQYTNCKLGVDLKNRPVQADLLVLKYRQWAEDTSFASVWFNGYDTKACPMAAECMS